MAQPAPIKANRLKCLDCSNNQPLEIKECSVRECPLYYYRLGKNPNRKGTNKGNPEAFKKYRESQTTNKRKEVQNVNTKPPEYTVTVLELLNCEDKQIAGHINLNQKLGRMKNVGILENNFLPVA